MVVEIPDTTPPINVVQDEIPEDGKQININTDTPIFADEANDTTNESFLNDGGSMHDLKSKSEKPIFSDDESDIQPRNSKQKTNEGSTGSVSDVAEETAKFETERPIFSDDEESFDDAIKLSSALVNPIFSDSDDDDDASNFDGTMEMRTNGVGSESPTEPRNANSKQKSKGKKPKHLKSKEKKRLKFKAPEVEKPDPVNLVLKSEIEIVKQLESGPTEAEIRRRQLIEVDPDVLEDKIERLNQITINALEIKNSSLEQKRQIRITTENLAVHLRDSVYSEFVESSLEKQMNKVFSTYDDAFPFNPLEFIKKGEFSDDEKESDKAANDDKFIDLSDSDDSDDEGVKIKNIKSEPKMPTKEERELEERKRRFVLAQARPQSSRTALLTALRQKVQETANENYCTQMRMQRDQLQTRLQIAEHCRKLVELLKARHENRKAAEREERRKKFQMTANSNEDEFDDGDDLEDGKFLTEEEKKAILEQFQEQDSASSEDGDGDDEDAEDEPIPFANAGFEADEMSVVQEELEGAREAILDSKVNAHMFAAVMAESAEDDNGSIDAGSGGGVVAASEISNNMEDEEIPSHKAEEPTQLDEVILDPVSMTARDDDLHMEENDVVVRYGRPSRLTQVDDDIPEGNEASSSQQQQQHGKERASPPKPKKTGNSLFRLQLEQEEQLVKRAKGKVSMLDEEAEEEEEEGHQSGLGDFGFGVVSKIRENDEEANALKLRKGDLDHIVDDVSDGEGDEEAAVKARVEMEIQEDKERTKAVITAVTEGRDAYKKSLRKGKYSFQKLVGDNTVPLGDEEPAAEEGEEMDFEEMLQRGLAEKSERNKRSLAGGRGSDSDSYDEADIDDGFDDIVNSDELTEEQKAAEMTKLVRQKEMERAESLYRKQLEETTKMNRELRRLAANGSSLLSLQQPQSQNMLLGPVVFSDDSKSPRNLDDKSRSSVQQSESNGPSPRLTDITNHAGIKRRTSLVPKKGGLNRTRTVGPGGVPLRKSVTSLGASSMYKGALSHEEVSSGFGMGMAVTASSKGSLQHIQGSERGAPSSGKGLFAVATGLSRSESVSLISGPPSLKRSFSGTLKRRSSASSGACLGSSNITVASQQFVFTGSSMLDADTNSRSHLDASNSRLDAGSRDASSTRKADNHSSDSNTEPKNSLFSKLNARTGQLKAGGRR